MGPTTGRRRPPPTVELAKSTLPSASRTPIVIRAGVSRLTLGEARTLRIQLDAAIRRASLAGGQ